MEYQITQIITYWVKAESAEEALDKWNNHPRTGVTQWEDGDIHLENEEIEVNG